MKDILSRNLKYLRKKSGQNQSQLGSKLGKAHTTIGNWEKGISAPSLEEIEEIARIFEITPQQLLFVDVENVDLTEKPENTQIVDAFVDATVDANPKNSVIEEPSYDYADLEHPPARLPRKQTNFMPRIVTVDNQGNENAVYVPVKARAGYLLGYGDATFIEKLPAYRLPGHAHGTYRIFEVDGTSMFPTLQDRDRVVARWTAISELQDDRVHVLLTRNDGVVIKRVLNRLRDGKLVCKSDNNHKGEYPNLVLDIHEILEAWYVVERWTRALPSPGEIYKRIVDLEADMAIIKAQLTKSDWK